MKTKMQNVAEYSKKKTPNISGIILDALDYMTWKQLKINGYKCVLFVRRVNTN